MKLWILIFLNFQIFQPINCIVYLRPWNDRGPAAVKAGMDCIEQIERIYFHNKDSNQVPNLAIFHSKNLTSPAMEIKGQYLFGIHDRILHQEEGEYSFQLKIISDDVEFNMKSHIMDVTLTGCYVIVTDHVDQLIESMSLISKTKSFNEDAKYLILFNNPDLREEGRDMACDFTNILFKQYRAINVVVMFANDAFSYEIYTGNPYGSEGESCSKSNGRKLSTCGTMKIIKAGLCTRGQLSNVDEMKMWLELDKIPKEMDDDCVFRFCARVQEPFVNEGCTGGLEIQIMNFLQEEMGFKLNVTCMNMDRGEPLEDGSWSHLLGEVRGDTCDIIAGAFFPDHDVHASFAATDFYFQDFYTFFVPKAPYQARWKGLITIFKPQLWYAALTVFVIAWIFWLAMGLLSDEAPQHEKVVMVFLHVLATSFGVSINNRPMFNPLRIFFAMLAIYSLILTSLYTSKLITVFTNPKYDYQFDSVEELLATELLIGGRSENVDWFDNDDFLDREIFKRYNFTKSFRPSPETLKRISNNEMALVISKLYVKQTKYRNKVFGFTHPLFSNHLEMLCERGFPLLKRINSILGVFRDAGIMGKLQNDFQFNSTILIAIKELVEVLNREGTLDLDILNELEQITDNEVDDGPISLKPEHLMGAFTILIFGVIISSFFFIIEQITNTKLFKKFYARICKFLPRIKCKIRFKFTKKEKEDVTGDLKQKIKLKKRRKRRFVYRTVRFTPAGHKNFN